jgi:hypothetical protein
VCVCVFLCVLGLFHRLAVRFASIDSRPKFQPNVFRHHAVVSLGPSEFVFAENISDGCIEITVRLVAGQERESFAQAWMALISLTSAVVSEHRSRSFGFRVRPRCPLAGTQCGSHALLNAGQYGEPAPAEGKVVCSLHGAGQREVNAAHLCKWWYGASPEPAEGVLPPPIVRTDSNVRAEGQASQSQTAPAVDEDVQPRVILSFSAAKRHTQVSL